MAIRTFRFTDKKSYFSFLASLTKKNFIYRQWIHHDGYPKGNIARNRQFLEWLRSRANRGWSGRRRIRNGRFWWVYGDDDWRIKDCTVSLSSLLKRNPAREGDLVHSTWGLPSYPSGQKHKGRWIRALHSAWGAQTEKCKNQELNAHFFRVSAENLPLSEQAFLHRFVFKSQYSALGQSSEIKHSDLQKKIKKETFLKVTQKCASEARFLSVILKICNCVRVFLSSRSFISAHHYITTTKLIKNKRSSPRSLKNG